MPQREETPRASHWQPGIADCFGNLRLETGYITGGRACRDYNGASVARSTGAGQGAALFSTTAEYALRAVAYLAQHTTVLSSADVIAEHTRVPRGYLSKVLNDLVNAGIVQSRRGPRGGFVLHRSPEQISVLEVVNAVDPIRRIRECPLGLKEHKRQLCRLHQRMDDAIALVEATLSKSTMAEMVREPSSAEVFPLGTPVTPTVRGRSEPR